MSTSTLYTLRVPFQLPSSRSIINIEDSFRTNIEHLTITLQHREPYYVLKIEGFTSKEEARQYFERVQAGLAWAMINRDLGYTMITEFDNVVYAEDPHKTAENLHGMFGVRLQGPIDGLANGNMPTIFPSEKSIRFATTGSPTVIHGTPVDVVIPLIVEGISSPNSPLVLQNSKVKIALELYASYFYEVSQNARFLSLIMALETLCEPQYKSGVALELIEAWKTQVELRKERCEKNSEDFASLEALERELIFRKETSIRNQLRIMVRNTLESVNNPDAQDIARRAVKAYDKRSMLVHQGHLPAAELSKYEQEAKKIVELVLRAKFGE